MRDVNEHTITGAVLEQFAGTSDARLRTLVSSLVGHLHAFVREVEPTFDEWQGAIDFLTRTGQLCDDRRQEFILLSDVLGVSMLVDALNHRRSAGATETTVLGPFHVEGAPRPAHGADIATDIEGERLLVDGRVVSAADGSPLAGARVEVWAADADGFYDVQRPELDGHALRATFETDGEGRFHFWTVMPAFYPIPDDGPVGQLLRATGRHPFRPAHVHFMISAPDHEQLVTHIFADDSPYLDSDAVFGVKDSLIERFASNGPGTAPDGRTMDGSWRSLHRVFGIKPPAVPDAGRQPRPGRPCAGPSQRRGRATAPGQRLPDRWQD